MTSSPPRRLAATGGSLKRSGGLFPCHRICAVCFFNKLQDSDRFVKPKFLEQAGEAGTPHKLPADARHLPLCPPRPGHGMHGGMKPGRRVHFEDNSPRLAERFSYRGLSPRRSPVISRPRLSENFTSAHPPSSPRFSCRILQQIGFSIPIDS